MREPRGDTPMHGFLIFAAALHAVFMLGELLPWEVPFILQKLSEKRLKEGPFSKCQRKLVAAIVHNAGIYNGIVAGGLFWAAYAGVTATDVARILLIGATVAGLFGTLTLKSPLTALQALVGIIGLLLLK
jgi:putative membrane protein